MKTTDSVFLLQDFATCCRAKYCAKNRRYSDHKSSAILFVYMLAVCGLSTTINVTREVVRQNSTHKWRNNRRCNTTYKRKCTFDLYEVIFIMKAIYFVYCVNNFILLLKLAFKASFERYNVWKLAESF